MSSDYNLCTICGGVKPTRYLFKPASETDLTPVPYPDTGAFPLCSCTTWFYVSEEQKKGLQKRLDELTQEIEGT